MNELVTAALEADKKLKKAQKKLAEATEARHEAHVANVEAKLALRLWVIAEMAKPTAPRKADIVRAVGYPFSSVSRVHNLSRRCGVALMVAIAGVLEKSTKNI